MANMTPLYAVQRKKQIREVDAEFQVQTSTMSGGQHVLYLGSTEVFFDKLGKLVCKTSKDNEGPGDILNQNKWFDHIANVQYPDYVMHWPFLTSQESQVALDVHVSNKESYVWRICGDNHEEKQGLVKAGQTISLNLPQGLHELELYPEREWNRAARVYYVRLTSPDPLSVVRTRWRPSAIHSTFTSSETNQHSTWIMGIQAWNPTLACYAPVTSPFGYYGFVLNAEGKATKGINFSLWSFGRGAEPPKETYKLSRLLAIGDSERAIFGHFSHEGTGVKVRDFNHVWDGNQSKEYVTALRVREEPEVYPDGRVYTYFGYYWDESQTKWRLYAAGQKFRPGNPMKSLFVKAFVEVPGPSHKERSGHIKRSVLYRGWVEDAQKGTWHRLDQMEGARNGLTSQSRGIHPFHQNRFYASMGGTRKRKLQGKDFLKLPPSSSQVPLFVQKAHEITMDLGFPTLLSLTKKPLNWVLKVRVPGKNRMCHISVFFGSTDGLTIASMWEYSLTKHKSSWRRTIQIPIQSLPETYDEFKFARVLVKDKDMQIWSEKTFTF